ncbi:hypothetical protein [Clostridium peptidivorans]|uniref:hypothetical protein n=1 Tax=Clostridium peptidivorans TaxID=100174 RepID=UPI000BE36F2A|nr:hypothetical protein [Clostridium peptidivorans]
MIKLEKFDGTKTYMFPNGQVATPEVMRKNYSALDYFAHIIQVSGNTCMAIQELGAMRNIYKIDEALTEDEAILAIEAIINAPEPEPAPTAEERIASALEYQNLLAMPTA